VEIKHNTLLDKILPDDNGQVRAVITDQGEEILCDLVGICTGVRPNIDFLKETDLEMELGILVDEYLQTNIPDVYAIGDCAQQRIPAQNRKPVEAVWYTGRMMGETLGQTLTGNKMPYNPGNIFNSAKFFDIEYQSYGFVSNEPGEVEQHLHWVHKDRDKFLTVAFNRETHEFLGINTYGIRMNHMVFDRWLTEKQSIEHVLANLKQANFDPEFYDRYEKEIFGSFRGSIEISGE